MPFIERKNAFDLYTNIVSFVASSDSFAGGRQLVAAAMYKMSLVSFPKKIIRFVRASSFQKTDRFTVELEKTRTIDLAGLPHHRTRKTRRTPVQPLVLSIKPISGLTGSID
jgi:hypothetical protein